MYYFSSVYTSSSDKFKSFFVCKNQSDLSPEIKEPDFCSHVQKNSTLLSIMCGDLTVIQKTVFLPFDSKSLRDS